MSTIETTSSSRSALAKARSVRGGHCSRPARMPLAMGTFGRQGFHSRVRVEGDLSSASCGAACSRARCRAGGALGVARDLNACMNHLPEFTTGRRAPGHLSRLNPPRDAAVLACCRATTFVTGYTLSTCSWNIRGDVLQHWPATRRSPRVEVEDELRRWNAETRAPLVGGRRGANIGRDRGSGGARTVCRNGCGQPRRCGASFRVMVGEAPRWPGAVRDVLAWRRIGPFLGERPGPGRWYRGDGRRAAAGSVSTRSCRARYLRALPATHSRALDVHGALAGVVVGPASCTTEDDGRRHRRRRAR